MRSRLFLNLTIGALTILGVSFVFHAKTHAGESWQLAYLGETNMRLAQQEAPAAPAAAPSSPAAEENRGPGWAVNCKSAATETGLECRISQTVVTQQGSVLTDVTFRVPADKKDLEAIVRMPLGIFLPAGAMLKVDDKVPLQLNFRACDRNGCYAQGPVSAEMLADLRQGKQLNVNFKNLAENPIDVPLSLDGFAEAYAKI